MRTRSPALFLSLTSLWLAGALGCAKGPGSGASPTPGSGANSPAATHVNMTGNWQFTATATEGALPFSSLAGFLYESTTQGATEYSTGSLMPSSAGCFANAGTIPLQGASSGVGLQISSFEVNGQILNIDGQEDPTGASFSGTYSVQGGCADADAGTLAGLRYSPLSGTYAGTLAGDSGKRLQLTLTQDAGGTGIATFLVTGSASVTGFGCFTQGTLPANGAGTVSGASASLTFTTNDPGGAQLQLLGTFDPAAITLTIASLQVLGGSCPGSLGAAVLTHT